MKRYTLNKTIEDEVQAESHYKAFLEFRERESEGYYTVQPLDVEYAGEVEEPSTSTPEAS